MSYLAIVRWDQSNRVGKFQEYKTLLGAHEHINRIVGDYPDAFAVENPGGLFVDWVVDPANQTVSFSPLPPSPVEPDPDDELDAAIEAANTLPELKAALLGRTRGRGRK